MSIVYKVIVTPVYLTMLSLPILYLIGLTFVWTNVYDEPKMSMLSNVAFVFAGVSLHLSNRSHTQFLVPFIDAAPMVLVLLGAASFAFHVDEVMKTTRHTLDIFFGWIVLLHASFVLLTSCVAKMFVSGIQLQCKNSKHSYTPKETHIVVAALLSAFFFSAIVVVVAVLYDDVYSVQQLFFVVVVLFSSISTVFSAFIINIQKDLQTTNRKPNVVCCTCGPSCVETWAAGCGLRADAIHLLISAAQLFAPASIAISAVFLQSEIIGIRHKHHSLEYDLWHGNWHFLLALLCLWLYSRAAHVAACHWDSPLSYEPSHVILWLIISVYALTGLALKETQASAQVSIILMFSFSCLIMIYILVVLIRSTDKKGKKYATLGERTIVASAPPRLSSRTLHALPSMVGVQLQRDGSITESGGLTV